MVPSRFGDESNSAGGKCNLSVVWLGSSVVEYSRGKRETLGSAAVTYGGQCESVLGLRGYGKVPSRFGDVHVYN